MGRLDYRTKFFTCVGLKATRKRTWYQNVALKLTNKTKKVVLQFQERFADKKMFEHGLKDSYFPFDGWLKETDLANDMCFTSRPFLKEIGEQRWFEMVATIRETSLVKFLQASGHGGLFVKRTLGKKKGEPRGFHIHALACFALRLLSRRAFGQRGFAPWGVLMVSFIEGVVLCISV